MGLNDHLLMLLSDCEGIRFINFKFYVPIIKIPNFKNVDDFEQSYGNLKKIIVSKNNFD